MELIGASSSRVRARLGGVFYLFMGVSGGLAAFARRGLIVSGNAAATALNIQAHQSMYLGGFAGEVFVVAFYIGVVAVFYRMFEPVNRTLALAAAYFGLIGCAIQAGGLVFYLAPLTVLAGAPFLDVFRQDQLPALAYVFLKLYSQAYGVAIVFFGFYCLFTGYLAFKSSFLPRAIGALMMVAGVSWLTFLSPPFAAKYFYFVLMGAVGEALFAMWLIMKGVNVDRLDSAS